jgi:hypothetical protein
MKQPLVIAAVPFLVLCQLFAAIIEENRTENGNAISSAALNHEVAHFDLKDATLIESLSQLSAAPISDLHLGIEEGVAAVVAAAKPLRYCLLYLLVR